MDLKNIKLNKTSLKKYLLKFLEKLKMIVIIILVVLIVYILIFLYNNFYKTITASRPIKVLPNEIINNQVNTNLLDKIEKKLIDKISLPEKNWTKFNNIFRASSAVSENTIDEADIASPRTSF